MSRYRRSIVPGGTWFFTVNLAGRQSRLLVEHIDLLRDAWRRVLTDYPFETLAICILPNHLHAIWRLPAADANYSLRWSLLKRCFSSHFAAADARSASKVHKREKGIWQRRFWEHQLRDEHDLAQHIQYIHFNPVKHGWVQRVEDWPYSSYHRFRRATA